ncbi:MAG: tRNA pseudouridine(38-40) synthase TruA [Promethearchaeota archaeon]
MIEKTSDVKRYLFKFYYTGSKKFFGSQRQKDLLTVEGCLLNTLKETKYIESMERAKIEFASRTDRFVSAKGNAFAFNTLKLPILMEINRALPNEIGLWAYREVPQNFYSRYNAVYRHYKYIVPQTLTFLKKKKKIDINLMHEACKKLEGEHNFRNFAKIENSEKKFIRDMDSVSLSVLNDYIVFDFKSRAFLRQQVRRMVRKILELGIGDINYEQFLKLFDDSIEMSYQPADPKGLILWDVKYDDIIKFKIDLKSKERLNHYFLIQENRYAHKQQLFRILQQNNFSE